MVRIDVCADRRQWSSYTDFYLEHRTLIVRDYPVYLALRDVKNCMQHGRAAVLINQREEAIGIGGFVLGLAEEEYEHKQIAVLGNSCFREEYRNTRTFIRGLQVLAEQIVDANPDVQEVRIPTAADNAYTNRLYRKLAALHHSFDSAYGQVHVYSTPFRDFCEFCERYR